MNENNDNHTIYLQKPDGEQCKVVCYKEKHLDIIFDEINKMPGVKTIIEKDYDSSFKMKINLTHPDDDNMSLGAFYTTDLYLYTYDKVDELERFCKVHNLTMDTTSNPHLTIITITGDMIDHKVGSTLFHLKSFREELNDPKTVVLFNEDIEAKNG